MLAGTIRLLLEETIIELIVCSGWPGGKGNLSVSQNVLLSDIRRARINLNSLTLVLLNKGYLLNVSQVNINKLLSQLGARHTCFERERGSCTVARS